MKIKSIETRESVTHNSVKSFAASKDCSLEMNSAGIVVRRQRLPVILVPWSNVRYAVMEDEG